MRIENMIDKRTKRYPVEFKAEAVRLLLTSGKSQAQLGSELGVPGPTLGKWKGQAIRNGDHPDPKYKGPKIDYGVLQAENQRLTQENQLLRQQREILKKSLGILSQDPLPKDMP
jgi:transposase-like protein